MASDPCAIFNLMPKVAAAIGSVAKGQINEFHRYKFRGIDDLYNAVCPALATNGVTMTHKIDWDKLTERTSKDKIAFHVLIGQTTRFTAPDGSFCETMAIGEAIDSGDKAYNKAMSAATKYALLRTFAIPTEDKSDTEHDTHVVDAPPAAKPLPQDNDRRPPFKYIPED